MYSIRPFEYVLFIVSYVRDYSVGLGEGWLTENVTLSPKAL